jgi:hypothetical protein
MSTTELAAIVAAVIMSLILCFQLLLAAGMPFAEASWGGRYRGVLPTKLRWASLASVGVIGLSVWVVLARAGLVAPGDQPPAIRMIAWGFAGFMALNTLGNLASKSRIERAVMTPATVICLVCFILVARS